MTKAKKKPARKAAKKTKAKAHAASTRPGLTPKEDRFVSEYLLDYNGAAAARRAGYGTGNPRAQAYQLMQKPEIQTALAEAAAARRKQNEATVDRVVQELSWMAFSRLEDYELGDEREPIRVKPGVPAEAMRAVSSVKTRLLQTMGEDEDGEPSIKLLSAELHLWDKNKAASLLMRHLGMYKEKQEIDLKARVTLYLPDNGRR